MPSSSVSQSMPRAWRNWLRRSSASSIVGAITTVQSDVLLIVSHVAPSVGAVAGEHLELVRQLVEGGREVRHLGVLGHQPQRLLLALTADHDRRAAGGDRELAS